jgi:hypothetical protein
MLGIGAKCIPARTGESAPPWARFFKGFRATTSALGRLLWCRSPGEFTRGARKPFYLFRALTRPAWRTGYQVLGKTGWPQTGFPHVGRNGKCTSLSNSPAIGGFGEYLPSHSLAKCVHKFVGTGVLLQRKEVHEMPQQAKTASIEPRPTAWLPEVTWHDINEAGAYVEVGTGDLY